MAMWNRHTSEIYMFVSVLRTDRGSGMGFLSTSSKEKKKWHMFSDYYNKTMK